MSERNLELVRRGIADVNVFWEMLDEHVVWDMREWPQLPDLESFYVGRDAVIQGSRHYWGTWRDYRVEAEELHAACASVVVILRERGSGKTSGASFDRLHPQIWTFQGDRVIRWASFQTREAALEAAGVVMGRDGFEPSTDGLGVCLRGCE